MIRILIPAASALALLAACGNDDQMAQEPVNAAQDAQGRISAMQTSFALHQLAHSHNMQVHGMPIDPSGLAPAVARPRPQPEPT